MSMFSKERGPEVKTLGTNKGLLHNDVWLDALDGKVSRSYISDNISPNHITTKIVLKVQSIPIDQIEKAVNNNVLSGLLGLPFPLAAFNDFIEKNGDLIIDFDSAVDGEKSEKYSKSAGVLGAATLGPLGLLAGNIFKRATIDDISIAVYLNDGSTLTYNFLDKRYKTNSTKVTDALEKSKRYIGVLKATIFSNEENNTPVQHGESISSELQQLAKLKDNGILTEEEFETQKHKFLNQ